MNRLSAEQQGEIISALVEGNTIRGTAKLVHVTRNTVTRYLLWIGEACQRFHDETVVNLKCRLIEADELWHFVHAKDKNLPPELLNNPDFGDCYTWIAMDPDSRLVTNWHAGKREYYDAQFFIHDLARRIPGQVQITTDQLTHYRTAIAEAFGTRADYATIRKKLGSIPKSPDGKFEQPGLKNVRRASVMGNPNPDLITTAHIERQNGTLRGASRRYARATYAFSKKLANAKAALAIHFVYYNFVRIHGAIRVPPAMEAGLIEKSWEIEDMVALLAKYPARKASKTGLLES